MSFVIDLSTLTAGQGFIIQGDSSPDQAGFAVAAAGDVNRDGIEDLIVGAPFGDNSFDDAGEAYVIYGTLGAARGRLDLTNLSAADGFIIQGDGVYDKAGWAVASAGDVNNDGIVDLIVGAPDANTNGYSTGEAYVIYGKLGVTRGTINLDSLAQADGFVIRGVTSDNGRTGYSVSSAGDVNGDGIADLIVGAPYGTGGGATSGMAYVVYGTSNAARGTVNLANLAAADGFVLQGDALGDMAGISVSSAGDVNGDGIDDLIVGAQNGYDGGPRAGEAYVIYGKTGTSSGLLDLTNLAAADGFIIQGDAPIDTAGRSVSSAGDVNGDGIDDLIVGAPRGDDGGQDAGEAYVIYGKTGATRGRVDLTNLASADGFIIQGDAANDQVGRSVASAGDVNGDGIDDLIVGAARGDDGGIDAGEAYVIYGKTGATRGLVDLTNLSESDGFIIQGDVRDDFAGSSVASAGDVNRDGFDDLIVGAPFGDDGGSAAGEAYVIYGFSRIAGAAAADNLIGTALRDTILGLDGNDTLTGGAGNDVLSGGAGRDRLTGGVGADFFEFSSMGDVGLRHNTTDVMTDFRRGQDKIDLSLIDASTVLLTTDDAFFFQGRAAIGTNTAGEISFKRFDLAGRSKDYTLVYIDTDGDRAAEGVIKVMGLHNFTAGDFIL